MHGLNSGRLLRYEWRRRGNVENELRRGGWMERGEEDRRRQWGASRTIHHGETPRSFPNQPSNGLTPAPQDLDTRGTPPRLRRCRWRRHSWMRSTWCSGSLVVAQSCRWDEEWHAEPPRGRCRYLLKYARVRIYILQYICPKIKHTQCGV